MRRRSTILIVAVLALGVLASSAQAGWSPTASGIVNLDTTKSATSSSLVVIGGTPWLAWREDSGTGAYQVHVARWNGSAWTTVGGILNVDTTKNAYLPQLVDVAGTPWVAWTEINAGNVYQVRVKRWTGSAWTAVGGALNVDTTKNGNEPGMASVGGTPYVVWQEPNAGNVSQVRVKRWDGSAWTSAGGSLNADPTRSGFNTAIADVGGTPYVTWREDSTGVGTGYQVHVKSWDGAAWADLGGSVNVDPTKIAQASRVGSVAGTPYVAWQEYDASSHNRVRVARWTGSAWTLVGGALNLDPARHAGQPSVTGLGSTPYVVWEDETGNGAEVHVARWTGSTWSLVGDAPNPGTTGYNPQPRLAFLDGVPYVTWTEQAGLANKVHVSRLAVDVLDQQATPSATGAVLTATVRDFGLPLPVAFQYGPGGALGTQTATQTTAGAGTATVTQSLAGLSLATGYAWRTVGLDALGLTALGATTTFTTSSPAPASPGATAPAPAPAPTATPAPAAAGTTLACKAAKRKVTCTVKLAAARSGAVRVALRRGSVTVATGAGRLSRGGAKLKLSARKRVKPGRYTLTIKAGKATIATGAVRIGR
jgi:hypothetical protein